MWGKDYKTMTQETKTAIQQAEKTLEQERKEQLQKEIYDYLKQELEAIDEIDQRISKLRTEKIAHEENIKNIKQGNLEAIEKRRQSFHYLIGNATAIPTIWNIASSGAGLQFYNHFVAGATINANGKTYIF